MQQPEARLQQVPVAKQQQQLQRGATAAAVLAQSSNSSM
jgi:hypothetical protein